MDWLNDAACLTVGPELFFPSDNNSTCKEAKQVCGLCDVRTECLQYALDADMQAGVFGGMTKGERDKLCGR